MNDSLFVPPISPDWSSSLSLKRITDICDLASIEQGGFRLIFWKQWESGFNGTYYEGYKIRYEQHPHGLMSYGNMIMWDDPIQRPGTIHLVTKEDFNFILFAFIEGQKTIN